MQHSASEGLDFDKAFRSTWSSGTNFRLLSPVVPPAKLRQGLPPPTPSTGSHGPSARDCDLAPFSASSQRCATAASRQSRRRSNGTSGASTGSLPHAASPGGIAAGTATVADACGHLGDGDSPARPVARLQDENRALREELARSSSGHALLEDEVRFLREELVRTNSSPWMPEIRRSMAAIAGGGFRGPGSVVALQRPCMCDTLRVKLAKVRAELKEAREATRSGTKCSVDSEDKAQVLPPPMCISTESQTQADSTVEAAVQYDLVAHADSGVQTASMTPILESAPAVVMADATMQATASTVEAQVQADGDSRGFSTARDALVQTVCQDVCSTDVQAGCPKALLVAAAAQTEALSSHVDVAVQALGDVADLLEPAPVQQSDAAIQTGGSSSSSASPREHVFVSASVQTEAASHGADVAVQVVPCRLDQGVQAQESGARDHDAALRRRIEELEEEVARRSKRESELEGQVRELTELSDVWRNAAQTKALGQMNVTILCPRAECTVNGDHLMMDSWDPKKLRAEFEREVLPRFSRVFVSEEANGAEGTPAVVGRASSATPGSKRRPQAVEQAMQEFASVFRERLSSMLKAPNAAAAVQSATASALQPVSAATGKSASGRRSTPS